MTVVAAGYMHIPLQQKALAPVEIPPNTTAITISIHGLRDTTDSWASPLTSQLASQAQSDSHHFLAFDWNPYSQNFLRCSVDGKSIGYKLGKQMSTNPTLEQVELVAHSCGSFVALGICDALKDHRAGIEVKTVYLDPVSIYGGFFWKYGLGNFGACADTSEAYIDTGDKVPGSNQALEHSTTYDVTQARIKAGYTGSPHVWPTIYYQELRQQK